MTRKGRLRNELRFIKVFQDKILKNRMRSSISLFLLSVFGHKLLAALRNTELSGMMQQKISDAKVLFFGQCTSQKISLFSTANVKQGHWRIYNLVLS